jgi:MFS family permease
MPERTQATGFLGKFTVMKGASPELWITFVLKFIAVAAYAITNLTLKLWLSSDFGYSDQEALALVLGWSLTMTVMTVLVGSLADALGLRRTFFVGVIIGVIARLVMVLSTNKGVAIIGGLFPLAIAEALTTPVLVAAVRTYSTTNQRSISFSTFYMMMNVGFLIAGYLFDFLRRSLGEHGSFTVPWINTGISTYRTLFLVGAGLELLLVPIVLLLRSNVEVTDEGIKTIPKKTQSRTGSIWNAFGETARKTWNETIRLFGSLIRQQGFYRLMAFLMLIAFLKLIFMQMYYVFPTFGIRELGEGAPVGTLWNINSWLILFLVPIIGALTQRFAAYRMVILGGIISAASVFIMALPTEWFQPLADGKFGQWLAHGYLGLKGSVHPYYVMIAIFVVVLSIGEAFYSPRVYEYAAAIAPKGQEASYSALSYVPFLLAKVLVGSVSGVLLAKYCPEVGERNSGTMWLVIGLIAAISPIGLITLRRFVRVHEAGREN